VAVKVTLVSTKGAEHTEKMSLHSMPAGSLVTVPVPSPPSSTVRIRGARAEKVAVTARKSVEYGNDTDSDFIPSATGGNFENLAVNAAPAATTITDDSDTTTVSLAASASVVEGANITYTATLTNPADGDVTVNLSNGATITILDGATTGTVDVTASEDR